VPPTSPTNTVFGDKNGKNNAELVYPEKRTLDVIIYNFLEKYKPRYFYF